MKIKAITDVKTAGEAQQLAIDWQNWAGKQDLGWGDYAGYGEYFVALAEKFPELKDEFEENGII